MSIHDLSARQRDLLFVVAGIGPASGQEIRRELQTSQDFELLPGALYTNLDELVEAGLVEKGRRNGRSNRYLLTDAGRERIAALRSWQRSYVPDESASSDEG